MLKPRRRLFRRRESWEWIKQNAYAGVAVLALLIGAGGWIAMFEERRPPSQQAPRAIADGRAAIAEEPPRAETETGSPGADKVQSSAPTAMPPFIRSVQQAENARVHKFEMPKSRLVARSAHSTRMSTAATGMRRHPRVAHGTVRHRGHAPRSHGRSKAHEDKSEAVYSGRVPGNMPPIQ